MPKFYASFTPPHTPSCKNHMVLRLHKNRQGQEFGHSLQALLWSKGLEVNCQSWIQVLVISLTKVVAAVCW
jgi:hypothetical protein